MINSIIWFILEYLSFKVSFLLNKNGDNFDAISICHWDSRHCCLRDHNLRNPVDLWRGFAHFFASRNRLHPPSGLSLSETRRIVKILSRSNLRGRRSEVNSKSTTRIYPHRNLRTLVCTEREKKFITCNLFNMNFLVCTDIHLYEFNSTLFCESEERMIDEVTIHYLLIIR